MQIFNTGSGSMYPVARDKIGKGETQGDDVINSTLGLMSALSGHQPREEPRTIQSYIRMFPLI